MRITNLCKSFLVIVKIVEEKIATIDIFHDKTETILSCEGVFQTLKKYVLKM